MTTTLEAAGLPFEEAVDFFRRKVPVHTQHWTDVWRTAHSRGFMVAGAASDALLGDFKAAIDKALSQGTTLAEFRADFDSIVSRHGWVHNGSAAWRSRVIYETNLSTAFSAGQYAQMTEPATLEAFPFWQYVHSGSAHPRLQHLAWNGLTLRADDPFWTTHYPPNGWHCGCRARPVSERGLGRMGKRGPDQAPPLETRPWRNPKTGEVHQVPVGIDPGFDYNPGLAWKRGGGAIPAETADFDALAKAAPRTPAPFDPLPFESIEAADTHLTDAYQPWAETLHPDEARAIDAYKGTAGRAINADLRAVRNSRPNSDLRAIARRIDGALARAITPDDLALFRGVQGGELAQLEQLVTGDVWRPYGFTSTTLDPDQAAALAPGGRVVEIRVRRGQAGVAYIHPFPRYRFRQYEALLNRRTKFIVVEKTSDRLVLEIAADDRN